ncbi:MAG TPA: VOC family protein [Candidatus Angelobacter sp.]|jgi:catechol 2,3-dioxygenase-like lactoylglutathione lyase family enzyme
MNHFSGLIVVCVKDIAAAVDWYKEKLELRESDYSFDDGDPDDTLLVSRDRDEEIKVVVTRQGPGEPDRPIFDTRNAAKAREWLLARGVTVGPVETDRAGTHYIELRDLDDNVIEICEEP